MNIIADDWDETLGFYRLLGLELPDGPGNWPPGSDARHTEKGQTEFDNESMARIWHDGWKQERRSRVVMTYSLASREAVDETYRRLTGAGHRGCQEPYDTFWGARYAVVEDPNGVDVGLMSPLDSSRGYVPEVPPAPPY